VMQCTNRRVATVSDMSRTTTLQEAIKEEREK